MLKQKVVAPSSQERDRLSLERHRHGWSQQEVADLLGTTPINVSRWERGVTTPNPYFRHKICQLFQVSLQELGLQAAVQETVTVEKKWHKALYDPALPKMGVSLVGRNREIQFFKEHIQRAKTSYTGALTGLPGIGKTALAMELVYDQEMRTHFDGGMLWVTLGQSPDLLEHLQRWGCLLGVSMSPDEWLPTLEGITMMLRAAIGQRRFLIVVDDAWSLQDALLCKIGGPNCVYVLTTRLPQVALAFANENTLSLQGLNQEVSTSLLRSLAPDAIDYMHDDLWDILDMVQGLPLALVLFGNYLRLQAHDGQRRRMRTALSHLHDTTGRLFLEGVPFLHGLTNNFVTQKMSLASVLARSEHYLDVSTRTAFRALSGLPFRGNPFSEEVALVTCGVAAEQLDRLCDSGLLGSAGPGLYTLHPLIADYIQVS